MHKKKKKGTHKMNDKSTAKKPYLAMAKRIKIARNALNKSQVEIAGELGWTTSRYGMYELGERSPKANDMVNMAKVLKSSPSFLMFGDDPKEESQTISEDLDDDLMIECVDFVSKVAQEQGLEIGNIEIGRMAVFCYRNAKMENELPKKSFIEQLFKSFCT